MPYSPCFCLVACRNGCVWQPIIGGHSWHLSIYLWEQYLHYGGHKNLGRRARTRHEKMKFCQGLAYKGPMFTKTVITWSFGVRFGPTSTQSDRHERGNLENTSGLRRRPSTIKFGPKARLFAPESKRTSFAAAFQTSFWTHWHSFGRKSERLWWV